MNTAEMIADFQAKKAVATTAEDAMVAARDAVDRQINLSAEYGYAEFERDRLKLDDLKHEHNVACSALYSAQGELKDRVHELRREVEKLWFKREEALQSFKHAVTIASDLEQEIREAFDGVRLLIAAIGYDPALDLVDEG